MNAPIRVRRPRLANQDGAAAVEFALVSVGLFTMLFGIIQYSVFFFQLSSAQSAVAAAARQVEVGDVADCAIWRQQTGDRLQLSENTVASWTRTDRTATGALGRGDRVTVTVDWTPIRVGAGVVPFPGSGVQRRTMEVRIDHIGDPRRTMWDATPGCPR